MTRKFLTAFLGIALFIAPFPASAQMSDKAVMQYISEAMASGKTKNQISAELVSKGVTLSQIQRLEKAYAQSGGTEGLDAVKSGGKYATAGSKSISGGRTVPEAGFDENPAGSVREPLGSGKNARKTQGPEIFGHNMFDKKNLTFEPNENMATPAGYVLGPGDEIQVDVFGMNEDRITKVINPEGKIVIANVGPVYLSGLTIEQATSKLRKSLAVKYSLGGRDAQSDIAVSLTNIRTIQVNVVGEVNVPGTYRLSSLSSALNAIYHAGGVTPIGSLRNVTLSRGGKTVATVDLYQLIFDGKTQKEWSLTDGDVIIVPTYDALVEVGEGVKRPMMYEAVSGESVDKVIGYAGGFASTASADYVSVERRLGGKAETFTVKASQFENFGVRDGDIIRPYLTNEEELSSNEVSVSGYVLHPGKYALGGEIATVGQLVKHAGGLIDGAFPQRAQLFRKTADRSNELQGIAIGAIMSGAAQDVLLQKSDSLVVYSIAEMEKKGDVEIYGFVSYPGPFEYAQGMTIEDLVMLAGGFEEGASSVSVEVGRRILVEGATSASETIANVYTCDIEGDLSLNEGAKFTLEPGDVVSVRRNPTYVAQRTVLVSGEVNFPGTYTLATNTARLSDIVRMAGGATAYANVKGASLTRELSEYERNLRENLAVLMRHKTDATSKTDSLKTEKTLQMSDIYTIGIDLEAALKNPGSDSDLILQDGDKIVVPAMINTVRIQGEVNYPNTVSYMEGRPLSYYVDQAGGWTTEAKRGKTYVVYMNGKVATGLGAKIMPGCEIVVPSKPEKAKMTAGEWLGIGTAAASIATSIATLVTLLAR